MASTKDPMRMLRGRLGAYTLHSRYDSRELVKPARKAFESKFEREVETPTGCCRSRSDCGAPRWRAGRPSRGSRR